ncbi:MAG: V-type ATP synthase subunit A [Oscillospiraceae bacterium]|nr:V-type ATP synthase subunit A [Oscillospiraceae bacterium]
MVNNGYIFGINGPVVKAKNMTGFKMREMVLVGIKKLIGEIIILEGDYATIQVYEDTSGVRVGESVESTGNLLSLKLGPGLLNNIFDGIERPLEKLNSIRYGFLPEGVGLISIDPDKEWDVDIKVNLSDELKGGDIYATIQETDLILHKLMVPPNISGKVTKVSPSGKYRLEDTIVIIKDKDSTHELKLYQMWPVRIPRPIKYRKRLSNPLITGQRVLDTFFPIAKGGAISVPGGFGTGKTLIQHQLAKWSDADIIVYIGCGERGNEITEILEDFPKLIDPKTGKALMNRTLLIGNTSNMPVSAREASIYTGITIAEYYRDMGYDVAIMADSTSRWAEALREISGRLEEIPAEEGYPAYLPSRLAEFYERAADVENLNDTEGSVTVIGAVSPAGGDFSEPVTQNTRRFIGAFIALDKSLANARHYPAISWLTSYSDYIASLENWFRINLNSEFMPLRDEMMKILYQEDKLLEIVKLVGEDVLPDIQRLILATSKIIKVGFLQQNAYNKEDTFVTLEKQYYMIKAISVFNDSASEVIKKGAPISKVLDPEILDDLYKMKYNVPNDDLSTLKELIVRIQDFFNELTKSYV